MALMTVFLIAALVVSTQEPPAIPAEFTARDAALGFPLWPGYRWTYRSSDSFEKWLYLETHPGCDVGGAQTTRLAVKKGELFWCPHQTLYVTVQGHALFEQASGPFSHPTDVYPQPRQLLPEKMETGARWTVGDFDQESPWHSFEAVVLGQEAVQVPAGEFIAWQIEYTLGWHFGTSHDLRVWYAPGIGVVRIEKWRESSIGTKTPLSSPIVHELVRIEPLAGAHRVDFPSMPEPVAKLPGRVVAPAGQLTLFADYSDIWEGQVVVYVVNKTAAVVEIPAMDGRVELKLEARRADGDWERAEQVLSSFCGNTSYLPLSLDPGSFRAFLGYLPALSSTRKARAGELRAIRYRLHDRLGLAQLYRSSNIAPYSTGTYDFIG